MNERFENPLSIGKGAFGEVYRAYDKKLERDVAVKKIPVDRGHTPRLMREYYIASQSRSPFTVEVFDVVCEEDAVLLVMEFVEGKTLSQIQAPLKPSELAPLLVQVAFGLEQLHSLGIVHGDLKPDNIFITDNGTAKIGDFGLAGFIGEERGISGTPAYIAPERLLGKKPDTRSDLYSLGVISYEYLSGSNPFSTSDLGETLRRQRELTPPPLKNERSLSKAVMSLLAKDPYERPSTAALFRQIIVDTFDVELKAEQKIPLLPRGKAVGLEDKLTALVRRVGHARGKEFITMDVEDRSRWERFREELVPLAKMEGVPLIVAMSPEQIIEQVIAETMGGLTGKGASVLKKQERMKALIDEMREVVQHSADHQELVTVLVDLLEQISSIIPLLIDVTSFSKDKEQTFFQRFTSLPDRGAITALLPAGDYSVPTEKMTILPLRRKEIREYVSSVLNPLKDIGALMKLLGDGSMMLSELDHTLGELVRTERLVVAGDGWHLKAGKKVSIKNAMELLSENARTVLASIAALGDEVPYEIVAELTELPLVYTALQELTNRRLLIELSSGRTMSYRIADPLSVKGELGDLSSDIALRCAEAVERSGIETLYFLVRRIELLHIAGQDNIILGEDTESLIKRLRKTRSWRNAVHIFSVLRDIYRTQKNVEKEIKYTKLAGLVSKFLADFPMAIRFYSDALKKATNDAMKADILNDIGVVYSEWGDYEQANRYYSRSLELIDSETNPLLASRMHRNLAAVEQLQLKFDDSEQHYLDALAEIERAEKTEMDKKREFILQSKAICLYNLGNQYLSLQQRDKTITSLLEAATISREIGFSGLLFPSLISIAEFYSRDGKFPLAMRSLEEAESMEEILADPRRLSLLLIRKAEIAVQMGEIEKLPEYWDALERIYGRLPLARRAEASRAYIRAQWESSDSGKYSFYETDENTAEYKPIIAIIRGQAGVSDEQLVESVEGFLKRWDFWGASIVASELTRRNNPEYVEIIISQLGLEEPYLWGMLLLSLAYYERESLKKESAILHARKALDIFRQMDNKRRAPEAESLLAQLEKQQDVIDPTAARGLLEIVNAINSQLDVNRTLETILNKVIEIGNADRGILLVYEGKELIPRVAMAREGRRIESDVRYSRTVVTEAVEGEKAVWRESIPDDDSFSASQSILDLRLTMVFCVPLLFGDNLEGVLYADAQVGSNALSESARDLLEALSRTAAIALHNARLFGTMQSEAQELRKQLRESHFGSDVLVGNSPKMDEIYRRLNVIAPEDVTVLITGETGTGKELVARSIHRASPRADGPFVAVNCAAIPETLLESELFGHEKGAFTGATSSKKGKMELAQGGTLFLDEIGDMPPTIQAKLLRAIENKRIQRLGSNTETEVDIRILVATNRDLKKDVEEGRFREDLYFRISAFEVHLPPLRERVEDIPLLTEHFIRKSSKQFGKNVSAVEPEVMRILASFDWSGNVRQLANMIAEMVLFCQGEVLTVAQLPDFLIEGARRSGGEETLIPNLEHMPANLNEMKEVKKRLYEKIEGKVIRELLILHKWNFSQAAASFGIHRTRLHFLARKYGLRPTESE